MNKNNIYDFMIDNGITSREEIILVTNINGYRIDVLNDIIYSKTGYRDIEQLKEAREV